MRIALDFDDTLMDTQNVQPGYRMGTPTPGAILATQRLAQAGNIIVIFTARNVQDPRVYKAVEDWLQHFKITYHAITNIKQPGIDYFVDNRAIHFDTWPQVLSRLTTMERSA